jgi:phosphatidylethanolamine-binding protein (PEBP) family uncharacterized protein
MLQVSSSAFEEGGTIPSRYTCGGEKVSPTLSFAGAPEGTRALALIVDAPDALVGTFTHWLAWGHRSRRELERALEGHVLETAELMAVYER